MAIKLNCKARPLEAVAKDLFLLKYQMILLQILIDNVDSALMELNEVTDRLKMDAAREFKLKVGDMVSKGRAMRRTAKSICEDLYREAREAEEADTENRMSMADGINEFLRIFRYGAELGDEELEVAKAKLTNTFSIARSELGMEAKTIERIKQDLLKDNPKLK